MSVMRNSPLVRWVGLLLICFGALLFGLEKAREWVNEQDLSPAVLTAVLLAALCVLVWWLRHRNRNANPPNAKGSREIKIHFSRGVQKALVLTFVVVVGWEFAYRVGQRLHPGTNVSRFGGFNYAAQQAFPATTHLLGTDRPSTANQQVFNPPAAQNEPTCAERGGAWNTDEIRPEEGVTQFILKLSGSPGYVMRPGDVVMVCVEANNARDLHKLYIRVGGDQIIDSVPTVWQPGSAAKRVWYAQISPASFQPEVDGTGGYLHFILKQGLTKPVRIFVRFN